MFDRFFDFVIQFAELFRFWVILEPYESGVQTRLGKFVRVLEPGLHWLIPFSIDKTVHEHTVPRTHQLYDQSGVTLDGKQIAFQAIITLQVRDIKKALLDVEDSEHAIKDACAGTIAHELSRLLWCDIVGESTDAIDKITAACRKKGFKYGLEIQNVQFSTMSLSKTIRLLQS